MCIVSTVDDKMGLRSGGCLLECECTCVCLEAMGYQWGWSRQGFMVGPQLKFWKHGVGFGTGGMFQLGNSVRII